jgi:hypothetical protein
VADRRSGGPWPGVAGLRYVKSLGDSVRLVLGNHDLHLLAVFAGISRNKPKDRLKSCWKPGCRRAAQLAASPAAAAWMKRKSW